MSTMLPSGILMGLATAPVGAWWLAWVALVPLWAIVLQLKRHGRLWWHASLAGLLWGIGYHGLALFWITGIHPMTWLGVPWLASLAIALVCWVIITLWGALLVTLWAVVMSRLQSSHPASWVLILLGTALWCGLEWAWSSGVLWWTSLSYTQSPHNLVILQLGQLSGPATITAAIVAVNGLLAAAWTEFCSLSTVSKGNPDYASSAYRNGAAGYRYRPPQSFFIAAVVLCCSAHLIGFWLYSRPLADTPSMAVRAGIIQGNIPNTIKLFSEGWRRAIAGYTDGYTQLAAQGVDLVLTPETALPFLWTQPQDALPTLYQAIRTQGVTALVGGFGERGDRLTNSLFTITGDGTILSRYDKVKLVPLGEYIPFEALLSRLVSRLSPLDSQLAAGEPTQQFETGLGRAIVSICYESAFANYLRQQATAGGELFLSAANNAHYSPAMPAQHHAQDVQRAIELDRWAIRAANTGYSGIVDPHGNTRWISHLNTYALHAATVYRRQTRTLYVRWGDWLTPVLLVLAAGVGGIQVIRTSPDSV
ncbi:MAG: apolipoprotein N-acyltransferase [Cyanobacteria bacterium]|nr:apolipoprotein N-acyltransferase [Cyanobacteriota bacterium]MDW8200055.1 apolipoprotein N-acyltransferase [Cyanobacteriota bacterium SKYGB_h_bin112]